MALPRALLFKPVVFVFRSAHVQEPRYLHRIQHLKTVTIEQRVANGIRRIRVDFGRYYIQILVHDIGDVVTPYAILYVMAQEGARAVPVGELLADELSERDLLWLTAMVKHLGTGHNIAYLFTYMTPAQLLDIVKNRIVIDLRKELIRRGLVEIVSWEEIKEDDR